MVRLLVAAVAALLLLSPAAGAQDAGDTEVARTGELSLSLSREGGDFCLTLARRDRPQSSSCGERPRFGRFSSLLQVGDPPVFAAAVPETVTAVGLDAARVPTVAVPGVRARFVLAPTGGRARLIRFFAGDQLVDAVRNELVESRRERLVAYRRQGVRLVLTRDFEVRADPSELDRTVPTTCTKIAYREGGSSEGCVADLDTGVFPVSVAPACAPDRPVLNGVLDPWVRRVDVRLGDGTLLRAPARSLGAGYAGRRFVAVTIPRGAAVREAVLRGTGGRAERQPLRLRPGGGRCAEGDSPASVTAFGFLDPARAPAVDTVPAEVNGVALSVGDAGRALCVSARRPGGGCLPAPLYPADVLFRRQGDAVVGVVPANVATVEVVLDDGSRATVVPAAAPEYTGRFAGLVGFVALALTPQQRVERLVLRDAAGAVLARSAVYRYEPGPPRTRVPGTPLTVRTQRTGTDADLEEYTCVRFGRAPACARRGRDRGFALAVSCDPRRMRVVALLGRAGNGLRLELADGRVVAPRIRRVRGLRAAWATLPRRVGLTAVRFRGQAPRFIDGRRARLALPPAAEQCGYDVAEYDLG